MIVDGSTDVVVNVDKLTYAGNLESLMGVRDNPRYTFAQEDITDRRAIRALLDQWQPDALINLAAESHVDRSIDDAEDFVHTNAFGTYVLLDEGMRYWRDLPASRGKAFRFLHVSTDEVFGSLGPVGTFNEDSPYRPNSPYAASKAASDHFVRAWHRTYGFPTITSNCSNNYGPFQFPEKLIPLTIRNALAGAPLPVYGAGENVRDWLYVDDHADALLTILNKGVPGQTYNVGGGNERKNIDVVRDICALLDEISGDLDGGRTRLITFVTDRPGHDKRYAIDASKVQRDLGWAPRHTFSSGLRKTVEWYVRNPAWIDHVLSGQYRGERLGLVGE
ncbi:MAG: dTDP-glucose 4,6-dehydratase [Gemmatimonadota bacterium]|nr:dTDP-glucose 4,6-dehydratase [Gemmatimonadota bacterium]